ncbi:hypothetical protein EVAR_36540_1 [Eumeta japonica]|uniref:Uncharacterized protein n=1 Tax=Eumeta variegata TaxID=151549 RepID=A0A4C1Z9B0_EUMVA|nr:hypothetical protein EVAR_36540_1 [Eumeta japonica]
MNLHAAFEEERPNSNRNGIIFYSFPLQRDGEGGKTIMGRPCARAQALTSSSKAAGNIVMLTARDCLWVLSDQHLGIFRENFSVRTEKDAGSADTLRFDDPYTVVMLGETNGAIASGRSRGFPGFGKPMTTASFHIGGK